MILVTCGRQYNLISCIDLDRGTPALQDKFSLFECDEQLQQHNKEHQKIDRRVLKDCRDFKDCQYKVIHYQFKEQVDLEDNSINI